MSKQLLSAEDFSLRKGQKIVGCDCSPFCREVETYFAAALKKGRRDDRCIVEHNDIPVAVLTLEPKSNKTELVIVMVRNLLQKTLGIESGIICDEGLLKGFVALQRRRVHDVFNKPDRYPRNSAPGFVVGRPLDRRFKILRELGATGLVSSNVLYDPGLWMGLGRQYDIYASSPYDDL